MALQLLSGVKQPRPHRPDIASHDFCNLIVRLSLHIVKDNKYVYTTEPGAKDVEFRWRDNAAEPGKTSYYYVRGEQQDGELVWASPFWITYTGK